MPGIDHKSCYGTMFPDRSRAGDRGRLAGKVFALTLVGPVGLLPRTRQVEVDMGQWDDCLECPEFDDLLQVLHGQAGTRNPCKRLILRSRNLLYQYQKILAGHEDLIRLAGKEICVGLTNR